MASPSERILIKRKLDEEPVEALYLQPTKRQRSNETVNTYWSRVIDPQASGLSVSIPSASSTSKISVHDVCNIPQVPKIRTTSPEEDLANEHTPPIKAVQPPSGEREKRPNDSRRSKAPISLSSRDSSQQRPDALRPSAGPRRFHFIKSSPFASSHTIGPTTKIQKHRKSRRTDLPIFIEKSKLRSHPRRAPEILPRIGDDIVKKSVDRSSVTEVYEQRPRKRPIVNVAEQKWRTENWSNSTKADHDTPGNPETAKSMKEASDQWDYTSEILAGQLQEVALREMNAATASPKVDETAQQMKVQPKPPKPRRSTATQNVDASSEDESTMDICDNESDEKYVYETYVRVVGPPVNGFAKSSEGIMDRFRSIDNSKLGVLIIAEEDQEEWETFAEVDRDSDKDWNSEEEDENAEDYYGNDYPEDEVNSDDQFDRGAYNYRAGASDEEEFDQDVYSWSDEDDEQCPWKHKAGTV